MKRFSTFALVVAALLLLSGRPPLAAPNPQREAFFGETHLHTGWSVDAFLMGNTLTGPEDALRYAQGQPIKHPMGYAIRIEQPLDWMGVTDHAEYVGVTKMANTPGSALSRLPEAQGLILKNPTDPSDSQRVFTYLLKLMGGPPVKAFMSAQVAGSIWKENCRIADAHDKPGRFTAFCAYEYTSQENCRNLHRNVFFRGKVPDMPFTALHSWHPEDLWKWMDGQRKNGVDLLAISHNANLSDGWMYPTDVDSYGRPIDAAWAAARTRNERLVELKQIKGQSETHPLLSPNDELASYEVLSFLIGLPENSGRIARIVGSYTRQALRDGLALHDVRGWNPYKFGFVSGSDSHNSAAPYRQGNFYGGHGINDGSIQERMAGHVYMGLDIRRESPAGLTGVWAEENTRASLFDAMYRRETFSTSGPRIKVRFFGGWSFAPDILSRRDWVDAAYRGGVPMGGDMRPQAGRAPTFVVWAVKDPSSARLDRIQIVKGWTKDGQTFEKIHDVAWAGDRTIDPITGTVTAIQSTVDVAGGTYSDTVGNAELRAVWTDPDFDPSRHAFYYARVLEIPTPRWTTIQAHQLGVSPPGMIQPTVQERAWSSPIWYTPSAEAARRAPPGLTVAALRQQGATELDDTQLRALVVGRSFWMRNATTGQVFKLRFDVDGTAIALHLDRRAPAPGLLGSVQYDGHQGVGTPYTIRGGRLRTEMGGAAFDLTFYRQGRQIRAARSNEFGYANYELLEKGPDNLESLPKRAQDETRQSELLHVKTQR